MFDKVLERVRNHLDPNSINTAHTWGYVEVKLHDLEDLYNQFVAIDNAYRQMCGQPPSGLSALYNGVPVAGAQAPIAQTPYGGQPVNSAPPPPAPMPTAAPAPAPVSAPGRPLCMCWSPKPQLMPSGDTDCVDCGLMITARVAPWAAKAPTLSAPTPALPDRMSIEANDPAYGKHDHSKYRVLINGVEDRDVVTADRTTGYYRSYVRDGKGDLLVCGGDLEIRDYFGKVEFELRV